MSKDFFIYRILTKSEPALMYAFGGNRPLIGLMRLIFLMFLITP